MLKNVEANYEWNKKSPEPFIPSSRKESLRRVLLQFKIHTIELYLLLGLMG